MDSDIESSHHVATPLAASPSTANEAKKYVEAMAKLARMELNSPKKSKVPTSCHSKWQACGGGAAVCAQVSAKKQQNRCSDTPS